MDRIEFEQTVHNLEHAVTSTAAIAEARIRELEVQVRALCTENAALKERRFPIQGGPSIPWRLLEPHERQAELNHGQSLKRLAERGGLFPCEALAVLEDRKWRAMDYEIAKDLLAAFNEWVAPEIHRIVKEERDAYKRERDEARADFHREVDSRPFIREEERAACEKVAQLEWEDPKRNEDEAATAFRIVEAIHARKREGVE